MRFFGGWKKIIIHNKKVYEAGLIMMKFIAWDGEKSKMQAAMFSDKGEPCTMRWLS